MRLVLAFFIKIALCSILAGAEWEADPECTVSLTDPPRELLETHELDAIDNAACSYDRPLKILLTGSEGFLGQRVRDVLLQSSHHVEVQSFDLAHGQDILDSSLVDEAIRGIDVVVHLAAVSNLNFFTTDGSGGRRINIEGTQNVLNAAKRHDAVVLFASTCCAYGNNKCHPSDETSPLAPTEPYAQSKAEGEEMVLSADERNIVMRLATFYGPGMRGDLAVARFIERAHDGKPLLIHGAGRQTRTLTHVDDVAKGIAILIQQHCQLKDRIFNRSILRLVCPAIRFSEFEHASHDVEIPADFRLPSSHRSDVV